MAKEMDARKNEPQRLPFMGEHMPSAPTHFHPTMKLRVAKLYLKESNSLFRKHPPLFLSVLYLYQDRFFGRRLTEAVKSVIWRAGTLAKDSSSSHS
eukprot:scaffold21097_cov49-Attheya_sp.AAC.4